MQSQNNGRPGEDSIKMSPEEEREELNSSTETHPEPADGGIGVMTDSQGLDPATDN